jgi:hypothetical protein
MCRGFRGDQDSTRAWGLRMSRSEWALAGSEACRMVLMKKVGHKFQASPSKLVSKVDREVMPRVKQGKGGGLTRRVSLSPAPPPWLS